MALELSKSVNLNGTSEINGTTSQGRLSANISKGNQLAINIYFDAPETLDQVVARTDAIQFISQVFAQVTQVAPATSSATSSSTTSDATSGSSNTDSAKSTETSTASK